MSVQRIFAKTSREALRLLKNELGEEAVILSNRPVDGGVEILAMPAADVAALTRAPVDKPRWRTCLVYHRCSAGHLQRLPALRLMRRLYRQLRPRCNPAPSTH